jgi:ABC-type transport system substrate-binding protein
LAVTDSDKDLSSLIYAGLMRQTPDGKLIPDLAEAYTISPDGTEYTFVLKPKASLYRWLTNNY